MHPKTGGSYLAEGQERKLARLFQHAAEHSPYYRDQDWAEKARNGKPVSLTDIPITPKPLISENSGLFFSDFTPPEDGKVLDKHTSGSTGVPVLVKKTERHFVINAQENRRLSRGWNLGSHLKKVYVNQISRANPDVKEQRMKNGGTLYMVEARESGLVIDLLRRTRATCLTANPSLALGVLQDAPDIDFLKLVETMIETVSPELKKLINQIPGCRHMDNYGAVETGVIAITCPECGNYHVANGHLAVEFLDDNDQPAAPGALARVIVTPLYNMAMPLLRYDIGDYVTLPGENSCPRSRVSIKHIEGREKNLFIKPDGSRIVPFFDGEAAIAFGLRKVKMVQTSPEEIEVRYIALKPDTTLSAEDAQSLIEEGMGPEFRAIPVKVSELPAEASGKYFMHECQI